MEWQQLYQLRFSSLPSFPSGQAQPKAARRWTSKRHPLQDFSLLQALSLPPLPWIRISSELFSILSILQIPTVFCSQVWPPSRAHPSSGWFLLGSCLNGSTLWKSPFRIIAQAEICSTEGQLGHREGLWGWQLLWSLRVLLIVVMYSNYRTLIDLIYVIYMVQWCTMQVFSRENIFIHRQRTQKLRKLWRT